MAGDRGPQPVRVLVIERSPTTGAALGGALEVEGMHVERTSSPEDAVESVRRRPPDLVVVEPLVAPRTCVEAVTRLRLATAAPVLVLSAVGPPMGGRAALVAAGVRAARAVPRQDPVMRFGELCIDVAGRRVETPGGEVRLTRKEMDLLVVLAARAGTVCTREELLESVWASSEWQDPATLSEHVHRLRRKLEDDPTSPARIVTVRGVGYRFVG